MEKMRFHILGMPHTKTVKYWATCAYTQKIIKLCSMLHSLGHEVYHYGVEGSEVECTHDVIVMSSTKHDAHFGTDWHDNHTFDVKDAHHKEWYDTTAAKLDKNLKKQDFILCMWGDGHIGVLNRIPNVEDRAIIVEPGIGYGIESMISRASNPKLGAGLGIGIEYHPYRVFESYTWMSYCYGRGEVAGMGCFTEIPTFDAVIPNYWDPNDFIFSEEKDDYFLFFGRCGVEKGTLIAAEVCRQAGVKLVVAGQNREGAQHLDGYDVDFRGFVDNKTRAELMSKAQAVLVPTQYHEPFGGVAVEAQMCGTPVISVDWGVFNETVLHGHTGYRCRTLDHYLYAIENVKNLDPHKIRDWAVQNFSLERVAPMYQEYFSMLYSKWHHGWFDSRKDVDGEWLKKHYPQNIGWVDADEFKRRQDANPDKNKEINNGRI